MLLRRSNDRGDRKVRRTGETLFVVDRRPSLLGRAVAYQVPGYLVNEYQQVGGAGGKTDGMGERKRERE